MNILVTGGLGFIGSNFINYRLANYNDRIYNVDKKTYAGRVSNIDRSLTSSNNYNEAVLDINSTEALVDIYRSESIEAIVHFAAESHVDRSISNAESFIETNINGTYSLLEVFRRCHMTDHKFIHISTDEVYGDLNEYSPAFTEDSIIKPNSPYAASKAASDLLCRSYYMTHNLPICITRCSNNYGPNQYPEKLIPLMIQKAIAGEKLPVYGTGRNIRDWIHVLDHCKAVSRVLDDGIPGDVYNIGGEEEIKNIDIVKMILVLLNISYDMIEFVEDRKGHDWRYAMDITKIKNKLDWVPVESLQSTLKALIEPHMSNAI